MSESIKKIGLVASSFDILHPGYLLMFKEAKQHCDHLITFLHKDPTVERPNKNKPVLSVEDRVFALESNRHVDKVIVYETEEDLYRHLLDYSVAGNVVRFLGDDYKAAETYTGKDLNIPIVWIGRDHGWSLTKLRKLIIEANSHKTKQHEHEERLFDCMKQIAHINNRELDRSFSLDLYNAISGDPVFDKPKTSLFLTAGDITSLIDLHGKAEGWWLPVNTGKKVFLSFGEWQLYYSLIAALETT